ncbi:MAG: cytidine deaminase [Calditrichaeota bacterium]|nr:cytidine deaminase [Calditrichota bacterium]
METIIRKLQQIKSRALAEYSNFHVGAILVTQDGEEISGFNIESSSYSLTICAERVALFKALSEGHRKFKAIYIMSDDDAPCPPCGACRQVLFDYAPDIEVIMVGASGDVRRAPLRDLLPYAFNKDRLIR